MKLSSDKLCIITSISFILLSYLVAVFADFLAPYQPLYPNKALKAYIPPVKWHFELSNFRLYFHTFELKHDTNGYLPKIVSNPKECNLNFLSKGSPYKLFGLIQSDIHLFGSSNCPDELYILGTDRLGRDCFSRLLHGLRPSLYAAFLGIIITFPLGIIYGTVSGFYKNSFGELMMRFVEVILSLPTLYLLVVLAGLMPEQLSNLQRLLIITLILALIGWAGLARVIRGQVLSLIEREHVQYAILIGSPTWKILLREIVPLLSSYLIINFCISFPVFVLGETTLSFLGLGISQPEPSLGNLLAEGRELSNLLIRPWLIALPGLFLFILAWNCNTLSDALRNHFDPKGEAK